MTLLRCLVAAQLAACSRALLARVNSNPEENVKQDAAEEDSWPMRDIFLFAGQSNCLGLSNIHDIEDERYKETPEHVFGFPTRGAAWRPYDQKDTGFNLKDDFGPELAFIHGVADVYKKKHESFGVVKVSKIGTNLRWDWSVKNWQYLVSNTSRIQHFRDIIEEDQDAESREALIAQRRHHNGHLLDFDEENQEHGGDPFLFSMLVENAMAAMHSPECENSKCRVKALIWVQGEADTREKDSGQKYEQELNQLVTTLRSALTQPDMFAVIAQLHPDMGKSEAGGQLVLDAEESWTQKQGPSLAALVPTKTITKRDDNLHYDANGTIELGRLAAKAYLQARN